MRIIKSLPLIAVLFTCVVILSSAAIFASEESTPSSEASSDLERFSNIVVPEEYKDPVYQYLASGDGVKAVTYTTTDIYNLLSIALYNEGTTNTWSLPRIAYWTHMTKNNTDSIHQDLRELHFILDGSYSGVSVTPSIQECLYTFDSNLNAVSIAQAISDFPSLTYSAINQLLGAQQNANYYLSQINSNLSGDFTWSSVSGSYLGSSSDYTSNFITSLSYSDHFNARFTGVSFSSIPSVIRVFLPYQTSNSTIATVSDLELKYIVSVYSGQLRYLQFGDYFIEPALNGIYIYLFDFRPTYDNFYFCVYSKSGANITFNPSYSGSLSYIKFDSDQYQQLKQAFYAKKFANSQLSMASDVNRLADYLADPDKIAAEQASQGVIDDTLDGFTGNGSAAAKTSDTGSMKNMSGSIQSGLNSGASASNAASVFSNQTFWSWFTQATSNGINNPYPAPVVQNTRGSGDVVPDFLSGNQAELHDLLNQRDSW